MMDLNSSFALLILYIYIYLKYIKLLWINLIYYFNVCVYNKSEIDLITIWINKYENNIQVWALDFKGTLFNKFQNLKMAHKIGDIYRLFIFYLYSTFIYNLF